MTNCGVPVLMSRCFTTRTSIQDLASVTSLMTCSLCQLQLPPENQVCYHNLGREEINMSSRAGVLETCAAHGRIRNSGRVDSNSKV